MHSFLWLLLTLFLICKVLNIAKIYKSYFAGINTKYGSSEDQQIINKCVFFNKGKYLNSTELCTGLMKKAL